MNSTTQTFARQSRGTPADYASSLSGVKARLDRDTLIILAALAAIDVLIYIALWKLA